MPILTFWGVTPSGASARAVFACPKGKKTGFRGPKWRAQKLSTIGKNFKSGNGEPGTVSGLQPQVSGLNPQAYKSCEKFGML